MQGQLGPPILAGEAKKLVLDSLMLHFVNSDFSAKRKLDGFVLIINNSRFGTELMVSSILFYKKTLFDYILWVPFPIPTLHNSHILMQCESKTKVHVALELNNLDPPNIQVHATNSNNEENLSDLKEFSSSPILCMLHVF